MTSSFLAVLLSQDYSNNDTKGERQHSFFFQSLHYHKEHNLPLADTTEQNHVHFIKQNTCAVECWYTTGYNQNAHTHKYLKTTTERQKKNVNSSKQSSLTLHSFVPLSLLFLSDLSVCRRNLLSLFIAYILHCTILQQLSFKYIHL